MVLHILHLFALVEWSRLEPVDVLLNVVKAILVEMVAILPDMGGMVSASSPVNALLPWLAMGFEAGPASREWERCLVDLDPNFACNEGAMVTMWMVDPISTYLENTHLEAEASSDSESDDSDWERI